MIIKDEINSIITTNGVIFVNDLVDKFNTENFIEIINILHKIGINNQKTLTIKWGSGKIKIVIFLERMLT